MARLKLKQGVIIIFMLLSCAGCRYKGKKPVLLRLIYQKGDVFDIRYQTYVTAENNTEPIKNEYVRMNFRVDSVYSNGNYLLTAKFVYVRVDNNGLIGEHYASDKPEAEMSRQELSLHNQFKPVLDAVFALTINNRGELVKPLAFANGTPIPKQFAPIDYENCQMVFPKDSVVIGDDWTNERTNPATNTKRITTYSLYSMREEVITIGAGGEFELPGAGNSQKFTGEYTLDQDTRKLISGKLEIKAKTFLEGDVKIGIVINGPR